MQTQNTAANPQIAGRIPRRIVIVGNTESAWMAAALLSKHIGSLNCRITVVTDGRLAEEFPGESTLPSIHGLLANLHCDEHLAMQACDATYQLATQFADWVQPERDFWLPFSWSDPAISQTTLFHGWLAERKRGRLLRPYHSYSLHWGASLAGKSPCGFSGPSPMSQARAYAFHVNGSKFAQLLRRLALDAGAEEIVGSLSGVSPNGRGGIAQLKLDDGTAVPGDFFIDASGRELALSNFAHQMHVTSADQPFCCDRIVSSQLPGRRQIVPYRRIVAMKAGWVWQMPLASSISTGYVYNSPFIDDTTAFQQLCELAGIDHQKAADAADSPVFIDLQRGQRQPFLRDNVLALGTAAWQLDPLISAGRHVTQLQLELFVELFPERSGSPALAELYNSRLQTVAAELHDFAQLHYLLSRRNDTEFWSQTSSTYVANTLQQRLDLYEAAATVGPVSPEAFPEVCYWYLLTGCGRLPEQPSLQAQAADPAAIQQGLREVLKRNEATLKELPLHEELLDWIHHRHQSLPESA